MTGLHHVETCVISNLRDRTAAIAGGLEMAEWPAPGTDDAARNMKKRSCKRAAASPALLFSLFPALSLFASKS